MKKWFSVMALSLSLMLTACSGGSTPADTSDAGDTSGEEVVKMGVIMPLTGDAASIGQEVKSTLEMFAEDHPTVGGKKFELIFEDGKCNGQEAASAAQKLINVDKVTFLMAGCSGETLGSAPLAERNKVLMITGVSTSPEVTTAGDYVFRTAPSDVKATVVMADILKEKFKKVALITQNMDYSAAYRAGLQKTLPDAGVEIVVDEAFNSGTTDFKSILQKIKDSEAEALINVPGEIAPAGFIAKQAKELGIELPMYGGDILNGAEFFEIGKDATEGTIMVITVADESRSDIQAFLKRFEAKEGRLPSGTIFSLASLDAMNILVQAIEEVGTDTTAVKDYLYDMPAYEGMTGSIIFDENGDSSVDPGLMVVKDGKFELMK